MSHPTPSRNRMGLVAIGVLACAATARATDPSRNLQTYTLFALDSLQTKGLTIQDGDVGVNAGALVASGPIQAPSSEVVADSVTLGDGTSTCAALFANQLVGGAGRCGPATPFASPIIADVAGTCGFPDPFPSCNAAAPVTVDHNQTVVLASGTYGDLNVAGGAAGPGTLILTGGPYVFCSMTAARDANILFQAPGEVDVLGDISLSNEVTMGPVANGNVTLDDIRLFSTGSDVHFSRGSNISLHLCAPDSTLRLTEGAVVQGLFVARVITTERIIIPSTTTTTATTSTTVATSPEITTTTTTHATTTSTTSTTTSPVTTTSTTSPVTTTTSSTVTTTTVVARSCTRTPGFFANHPDVTQSIISSHGGSLSVCGIQFTNTDVGSSHSAIEALCVSPQGDQRLQLVRQLLTAALNSAGGCATFTDFSRCDAVCQNQNASTSDISDCTDEADAFNNSGDNVSAPFDTGGAASPGKCKMARKNSCVVTDPGSC